MSGRAPAGPRPRRRRVGAVVAGVAVVALVGAAVWVEGFDTRQTERVETSVWVARDSGQYARFDTDLGQIDTIRQVDDPTQVLQHGSTAVVVTQGTRTLRPVDAADPADLRQDDEPSDGVVSAPDGTSLVDAAGDWAVYLTDAGQVWAGRLDAAADGAFVQLRPLPPAADATPGDQAETPQYVASAATVDPDGRVAVYSAAEGAVRVLDASSGALVAGPDALPAAPGEDDDVQVALVAGRWALLDAAAGRLWLQGRDDPVDVDVSDAALLQQSAGTGAAVAIADASGLVQVDLGAGTAARTVEAAGTPARPVALDDGTLVAAWLTSSGGSLWTSGDAQPVALDVAAGALDDVQDLAPTIAGNGARAVLAETTTGLMWTVPDGAAVPAEQWTDIDRSTTDVGTQVVDEVAEEMPPTALPDAFGVRSGADVRLPVLLNDSDPNSDDVLTIVPESLAGGLSDPAFGTVSLAEHDQLAVVHVLAASGSASFTYQVTDGVQTSDPVTVDLSVVEPTANDAPAWCAVEGCTQTWPNVALAPGGTARVRLLDEWVDPDGDPFVLTGATVDDAGAPVRVVGAADGTLTVQHTDPNGSAGTYPVTLTVTDAQGAVATRALSVVVTGSPVLDLEPIAVVVGPGLPAVVAIDDHVRSGSGSYELVDAVASAASTAGLTVVPSSADGTVQVTAAAAGQYEVTYTVRDTVTGSQQSSSVRVQCVDGAGTASLAPMTAFVRDHEDTTVDVISAVQSTSDAVLMVAAATASTPGLGVDVVDGRLLRLRGTTTDGQPGLVGTVTVTVTDGAAVGATGSIAVFLTPTVTGQAPIAVPDSVTVRAGAQVDVPVTANDVAPAGARLVVLGEVGSSGAPGELVFASGGTVRYLAPDEPGVYRVDYSVALATDATKVATSTVTVTVVPAGTNRAPTPGPLTARVRAGGSVRIDVPRAGSDPDGDPVTLVHVSQPATGTGSATVSATGDAIVYTAPTGLEPGDDVSFTYTVRDPAGEEGTATVRLGVLTSGGAVAPIAYTDRVRVRSGDPTAVSLEPLLNDRDPAGGTLTLTAVRPDAVEGSAEQSRLAGLLDDSGLADGTVQLLAGDVLGVHAYVYTVQSDQTGSTAEGLLVVEVTDGEVADPPVVTDTVLTAGQRADLSTTGVDVVAGKVVWPSGDPGALTLAVWGDAAGTYTATGGRIVGPLPAAGALVPFSLTGTDRDGEPVTAYGFLRVPAFDAMRVVLSTDAEPIEVDEGAQADADLLDRVSLANGDSLEVDDSGDHPVQRPAARCTSTGATTLLYSAGNGQPWKDTCVVSVRLSGQTTWSDLPVPVVVAPQAPQPVLSPISRTVPPGDTESVDLTSLVTWEGDRVGDLSQLVFTTSLGSDAFTLTQSGSTITVVASAKAVPGTRATVDVRSTGFGGLATQVELVVGQAAQDAPRGATVPATCDVRDGASCQVTVVGVAGEYDPFAGKQDGGLTLDHVGDGGTVECLVATVQAADARSIRVTWPSGAKPAGGTCTVPFTVADAQGRLGTGVVTVDVLGYPAPPASVQLDDFGPDWVTLYVDLGSAAATAHPAVTGASIAENGAKVTDSCTPSGATGYRCTVSSLVNGQQHSYTARVRNATGDSADTSPVTAWAYRAPGLDASDVLATSVFDRAVTTDSVGVVRLDITSDDDVRGFLVGSEPNPRPRTGATTTFNVGLPAGQTSLTITPVSLFSPPLSRDVAAAGVTVAVAPIPRPLVGGTVQTHVHDATITVDGVTADGRGSPTPVTLRYVLSGSPYTCQATPDGGLAEPSGGDVVDVSGVVPNGSGTTFTDVPNDRRYTVTACATNGFGVGQASTSSTVFTAPVPGGTPTYSIATTPTRSGSRYDYVLTAPNLYATDADRFEVRYSTNGGQSYDYRAFADAITATSGAIQAAQCSKQFSGFCSSTSVAVTASSRLTRPVSVTAAPGTCPALSPFTTTPSGALADATSTPETSTDGLSVTWTLDWTDSSTYGELDSISVLYEGCVVDGGGDDGGDDGGGTGG